MRITKEQLKQIIKEEMQAVMNEDDSQQALVSKIVEMNPEAEDALDEYILSSDGDWESDYVNQIGSMGLEAVARDWLNDYEQGNLGDALAAFDAQDKEDAFYLREAKGETPQQAADRIASMPPTRRSGVMMDFEDMADGDTSLQQYYPHVKDLAAFAREVLSLIGNK